MFYLPFLLIVVSAVFSSILLKLITDNLPRIKALFIQYLFCSVYIFIFWLIFDRTFFSIVIFLVVGLGPALLNYIGTYSQWAAYKMNMSRTSLSLPWISLLSVVLFSVFLREYKQLSPLVFIGVFLQLASLWFFGIGQIGKGKDNAYNFKRWLFFVIVLVIAQVLINFWMKALSFNISIIQFSLSWYSGNFFFSSLALPLEKEKINSTEKKLFLLIPLLSAFIVLGTISLYWAFQSNAGTVVTSFSALISTFVPALIGWFIFGEKKNISKIELAGILCGAVAAVFILFPY